MEQKDINNLLIGGKIVRMINLTLRIRCGKRPRRPRREWEVCEERRGRVRLRVNSSAALAGFESPSKTV